MGCSVVLEQRNVVGCRELEKQVRQLYCQAFPKEERVPWWLLLLNSQRKGIDLTAWMEEGQLIGFTASVTTEKLHFLLFFAILPEYRGKGFGSAILGELRKNHPGVVLNVETLDPEAENYPQRQSRFAFYRKNGFFDTGWHVWEIGGKFRVLSTQPQLDIPAYKQVFRKLSFGLWNVKLREERKS